MLNTQPLTRIALLTVLSVSLMGSAILILPHVKSRQERQLALRLITEMELADSSKSRVLLRQIASLGDSSLEALVMAAASEHADIALQARQIIREKLGTWKTTTGVDPGFDLGRPTRMLASTLAMHIHEFGPLGGQWSSSLALELVDLSEALSAEDAASLLADCGKILNQVPALGPRMRTLAPDKKADSVVDLDTSTGGQPELELLDVPSEQAISSKPANLALPNDEIKRNSTSSVDSPMGISKSQPSTFEWAPDWPQDLPPETPLQKSVVHGNSEIRAEVTKEKAEPIESSTKPMIDVPSPDEMQSAIAAMHTESTRTLVESLATADFYTAGTIRLVLRERGFTNEELSVLERLLSNDPADRLRLVQDLKVLPARPARRCLRVLLEDNNPEVRLEALTALATTKDPDLVGLAREMVVHDQDSRISELAARIIREAR